MHPIIEVLSNKPIDNFLKPFVVYPSSDSTANFDEKLKIFEQVTKKQAAFHKKKHEAVW